MIWLIWCAAVIGLFGLVRGILSSGSDSVSGYLTALAMACLVTAQVMMRRKRR